MKQVILGLLLFLTLPISGYKIEVDNSLTIKNNTRDDMEISLVWYRRKEHMWVSSGWWTVSRYDTKRFDLRIFDLDDNNMFFAARCNGRYMKGANEYRVDKQNNFEIIGADRFTSKDETTKFQSVMVGKGDKVVVVNTF